MDADLQVVSVEIALGEFLFSLLGVRFKVKFQRNGQLHLWASRKEVDAAAADWESRGRGRPQGDQAAAAA